MSARRWHRGWPPSQPVKNAKDQPLDPKPPMTWPVDDTPYTPSEQLMGTDGQWNPAPVERWPDEKRYMSEERIREWNAQAQAQLDKFCTPLDLLTVVHMDSNADVSTIAIFCTGVMVQREEAAGQGTIMEHMVPRYWTPEVKRAERDNHDLNADTYWEYHKTAPPHQEDVDLNQVLPWWQSRFAERHDFLDSFYYPEVKLDFSRPFPNETSKETKARQQEKTGSGRQQVYLRKLRQREKEREERVMWHAQCRLDDQQTRRRAEMKRGAPPIKYFQPGVGPLSHLNGKPDPRRANGDLSQGKPSPQSVNGDLSKGKPSPYSANGDLSKGKPSLQTANGDHSKGKQIVSSSIEDAGGGDGDSDDWSLPSFTLKPRLRLLVRPATDMDVPSICKIYNHYITSTTSCAVPEMHPLHDSDILSRLQTARAGSFPFLVAIKLPDGSSGKGSAPSAVGLNAADWPHLKSTAVMDNLNNQVIGNWGRGRSGGRGRGHGRRRGRGGFNKGGEKGRGAFSSGAQDRDSRNKSKNNSKDNNNDNTNSAAEPSSTAVKGPIVGFIYATAQGQPGDTYRFTTNLQFLVAPTELRHGVGAVLLDACLPLLDRAFEQQRGYDLAAECEPCAGGPRRCAKSVNVSVPFFQSGKKDKERRVAGRVSGGDDSGGGGCGDDEMSAEWCAKWLEGNKLGFERVGVMREVGVKGDRLFDVVLLQRRTGEEVVRSASRAVADQAW